MVSIQSKIGKLWPLAPPNGIKQTLKFILHWKNSSHSKPLILQASLLIEDICQTSGGKILIQNKKQLLSYVIKVIKNAENRRFENNKTVGKKQIWRDSRKLDLHLLPKEMILFPVQRVLQHLIEASCTTDTRHCTRSFDTSEGQLKKSVKHLAD